jgi:hypothetical protein
MSTADVCIIEVCNESGRIWKEVAVSRLKKEKHFY